MTSRLSQLGWNDHWQAEFDRIPDEASEFRPARVVAEHRGRYLIATEAGDRDAVVEDTSLEVALRLATEHAGQRARLTVGDWIAYAEAPGRPDGAVLVRSVLPRTSQFVRQAPSIETKGQVVAVNLDLVFVVTSIGANLNLRRLERFLALAWESGASPVVVVSKIDLLRPDDSTRASLAAVALGAPVHWISSVTGEGLDALRAAVGPGRTAALLGSSGVGKSSLVNALVGAERLVTAEIRRDGKGRHTTTHRELVPLPSGGCLIDTPGMRGLRMWNAEDGLEIAFEDVASLATRCRFRDCRHQSEPGCAVRGAVESGVLGAARLKNYVKLRNEEKRLVQRQSIVAKRQEKQRVKVATKRYRVVKEQKWGRD